MHITGPPVDVGEERVRSVKGESALDIIVELGYIDSPEIYYRAADAMILPYTRAFGQECTSQTLEEATSSFLSVIVPEFGSIGRVTREWELGLTYGQDSDGALERALRTFARGGVAYSEDRMERYNRLHSYESAATTLASIYRGE